MTDRNFTVAEIILMLGTEVVPPVISVDEARELLGLAPIQNNFNLEILYKKIKMSENPPTVIDDTWQEEKPVRTTSTNIWMTANDGNGWSIPVICND